MVLRGLLPLKYVNHACNDKQWIDAIRFLAGEEGGGGTVFDKKWRKGS